MKNPNFYKCTVGFNYEFNNEGVTITGNLSIPNIMATVAERHFDDLRAMIPDLTVFTGKHPRMCIRRSFRYKEIDNVDGLGMLIDQQLRSVKYYMLEFFKEEIGREYINSLR